MNRLLYDLQEIDNAIARLKRERSKLDDGSALRAERDTLQKAVAAEKDRLSHLNATRSDQELQLATAEEKITRQQGRLMNATNAHEVNSLQRDINALNKARGDLDEAILMLMDDIENCSARLVELQNELEAKAAETTGVEAHFAAETARLETEIASAVAQRQTTLAQLNDTERGKYEDAARRFHGLAVAHNEKGACSACGMSLTPYNIREAKAQEWPVCDSCGRLLFVE